MNKMFSLSDLTVKAPAPENKSSVMQNKFLELHSVKLSNIKDLLGRFPSESEAFFLWTVNSFNAFTFVPYVLNNFKEIEQMIISTYSINSKIINEFTGYLDAGLVKSIELLISDSAKFRIPKVVDHLEQINDSHENFHLRYAWNHSKVTLMKTKGNHFVIEGSGNFSENSRHEQYVFLNSKNVFDFRKDWIANDIHGRTN